MRGALRGSLRRWEMIDSGPSGGPGWASSPASAWAPLHQLWSGCPGPAGRPLLVPAHGVTEWPHSTAEVASDTTLAFPAQGPFQPGSYGRLWWRCGMGCLWRGEAAVTVGVGEAGPGLGCQGMWWPGPGYVLLGCPRLPPPCLTEPPTAVSMWMGDESMLVVSCGGGC